MAKFNFFKHGLALLVLALFIGDAYSFALVPKITDSDAAYKAKKEQQLKDAIKEITSPNTCLTDPSILCFIDLVNREYNGTFEMADVCLSQLPELYKDHAKTDRDDVQILYGGSIGNVKAIGHYITIFYKASEERVYVYDSFFSRSLSRVQQEIVETLYPKAKYVRHVKPATRQPNGTSCGVFAIASATHLILGKNPKNTTIKLDEGVFFRDRTMTMRNHLKDMLLAGKLSQFPA